MQEAIRHEDVAKIRLLPKYATLKKRLRGAKQLWHLSPVSFTVELCSRALAFQKLWGILLRISVTVTFRGCAHELFWYVSNTQDEVKIREGRKKQTGPSICVLLAARCMYMIYFQTTAFHNLIRAPILNPKGIFLGGACQIKGIVVIRLCAPMPTKSLSPPSQIRSVLSSICHWAAKNAL